ncbi:RagB/SusD family nutrient uptake outer membrane protein [Rhodohalobacter sp. 614A]|uniref:RagB/SusD family nutrient uptake outer membrane protein n=1 Tax=Rhodohalobacter sp. 614A TaxID=2908649 RepID=UPI001F1EABBE|nr:RagB/SusD family nutrient uptake outer membrane protein [Rhodohalobacter sp. 614A]
MKKLIIILAGLFIFMACEDFLTENPKTEIDVDQFFDSPDDARSAVNAFYRDGAGANSYDSGGFRGSNVMIGAFMTGLFDNEAKGERIEGQLAQALDQDPVNFSGFAGGWWNEMYRVINRANLLLVRIEDIAGMDENERQRLIGEARYFRALNYFTLVKLFGDVPLILEPFEGLNDIYVERVSSDQVYTQIIEDLNWTMNNASLPNVPFGSGNNGRITHGTVATLLAKVHLQRAGYPLQQSGAYAEAASSARQVIQSGVYSLIEHGSDVNGQSAYNQMRTSQQEPEYIWSIEYDGDISDSQYPRITIPGVVRPTGIQYSRTLNMYRPIDEFIQIYDPDLDLRIQNHQMYFTSLEVDGEVFEFGEYVPYIWFEEQAIFETARGTQNLNVTRYSEVLLIAAEAIAQSEGVTSEAVGYLADVRDRAYWTTPRAEIVASLSGLTVNQFVEEVWKERYRELALDFEAWHDIQRTRKYPTTSSGNPGEVTFVDVIGASNNWGQTYSERDLLYPIPDDEMQRNESLTQNPGY